MSGTDYIFLAFTNPVARREAEFNEWYTSHHIPEVVTHGRGFSGGRRYRQHGVVRADSPIAWRYLALYDMTSDDLLDYHRRPWSDPHPPLTPFTGLLQDGHAAWIFSPEGPRLLADERFARGRGDGPAIEANCLVMEMVDTDAHRLAPLGSRFAQVPAAVTARQYVLAEHQRPGQPVAPARHLVLYEFDGRDATDALSSTHRASPYVSDDPPGGEERRILTAWVPVCDYVTRRAAADLIAARD